jgi:AAA+ superfamily predicted ATPase
MGKNTPKMSGAQMTALAEILQMTGHTNDGTIKTEVVFSKDTAKVIVPAGMSKKDAAEDLMLQWENEEQMQDFVTTLEGWEWKDGLYAYRNVVEEKFGWIKGRETMFTSPTEIDIVTSYQHGQPQTEKAFIGSVNYPAWEDAKGSVGINDNGEVSIKVRAKRKFSPDITLFFKEIRQFLLNRSIYRGKPVIVTKDIRDGKEMINLEITEIRKNPQIFLNEKERTVVENFILSQLEDTGKRCFLFVGTYGNGKTETALNVGVEGVKRNITFFYVKDSSMFEKVLGFARNYEPAIIFVEDVDEIASGEQRDERINKILNTVDGVQTKGRNITIIFTTNHEKRISPAMRRPGRIDLIVNFLNPDKETTEKIYRSFFDRIQGGESLDYEHILDKSPDVQGAVIAEIAKRAVKLSQRRGFIDTDMVIASIASLEYQIKFMKEETEAVDPVRQAYDVVRNHLSGEVEFTGK